MAFQKIKAIKAAQEVTTKKKGGDKVSNEIDLEPQDNSNKSPLEEAIKAGAVISFGRMNPPTIGHEHLVANLQKQAAKKGFTPVLILSKTTGDSKNPLTPAEKLALAKKAFPGVQVLLAKDFIEALKQVSGKYASVDIMVGSDRVAKVQGMLKYNGKEFHFKDMAVLSAGERDPDADDVTGMSASKMRALAAKGDIAAFKLGLPAKIRTSAEDIMTMINEELENEAEYLDEALDVSARLKKRAQFRRIKSRVKIAIKRAKMRRANAGTIDKRAKRAAKMVFRRRFSGGKKWSELSLGQRVSIDKRLKNKGKVVARMAKRLVPKLRRAEQSRKLGSNFIGLASLNKKPADKKDKKLKPVGQAATYKRVNEAVNASLIMVALEYQPHFSTSLFEKLFDLSVENQVPLEYVVEQYRLGYAAGGLCESEGFARVHSALHEGLAAYLTEDASIEPGTTALHDAFNASYRAYTSAAQAHWNVKGTPNFYALHGLFGEIYEEIYGSVDDFAELIRAAGFDVRIPTNVGTVSTDPTEVVKEVLTALREAHTQLMIACNIADEDGQDGQLDFLGGRARAFEKHIWMLKSSMVNEDMSVPNLSSGKSKRRVDLPQISDFDAFTKDLANKGVDIKNVQYVTDDLTPTQKHFNQDKVDRIKEQGKVTKPIVVSNCHHVVDGHHRWLAAHQMGQKVNARQIDMNVDDLLDFTKNKDYVEKRKLSESVIKPKTIAEFRAKHERNKH